MKFSAAFFLLLFLGVYMPKDSSANKDSQQQIDDRVEELINKMTLQEKITMIGGDEMATIPVERLGIPALKMTDGPIGVRWGKTTAFPSGIAMASTWDTTLIEKYGEAIGQETKGQGRDVILGPCVNIARLPMGGRNFESYGEDPFLTSRLTVNYIKGVQKEGVAATAKHFAVNNQEHERMFVDAQVDERTLNEIYLPAFKAAVEEADVLAVMSAYNKLNGKYCSEKSSLLIDKLRNEWGFQWLVMSDWGAVHSSMPTFKDGVDLEMPRGDYLNYDSLKTALEEGVITEKKLDEKIRRILKVMFKLGLFDSNRVYDSTQVNSKAHQKFALDAAKEAIVLLKNEESILPLNLNTIKSLAVIGPNADVARTGGGGSSMVNPVYSISPLEGLKNILGDKVKINFEKGVLINGDTKPLEEKFFFKDKNLNENGINAEYFDNKNLSGEPVKIVNDKQINFEWDNGSPFKDFPENNFSVRWTTYLRPPVSGEYELLAATDDGVKLYLNDKLLINDWVDRATTTSSCKIKLEKDKPYKMVLEYYENGGGAVAKFGWNLPGENKITKAVEAAKNSDAAIIFAGTSNNYESEGFDRKDLVLPAEQDKLIEAVSKVNPNTIVVLITGSPVLMNSWIGNVKGIVEAWFNGEEIGNAIAEVLTGKYNPSGKLPVTFPKRWEDCSAYPYYMKQDSVTKYGDGIFVGYRHFDKNNIEPLFPFGFGLSYTNFEYKNFKLENNGDEIIASFDLKNTGKVAGSEIAQLYVRDVESSVERPVKELKGFSKIRLNPGETKNVKISLNKNAFMFFDPKTEKWTLEPGEFEIMIGSSSRDIYLKDKITL